MYDGHGISPNKI